VLLPRKWGATAVVHRQQPQSRVAGALRRRARRSSWGRSRARRRAALRARARGGRCCLRARTGRAHSRSQARPQPRARPARLCVTRAAAADACLASPAPPAGKPRHDNDHQGSLALPHAPSSPTGRALSTRVAPPSPPSCSAPDRCNAPSLHRPPRPPPRPHRARRAGAGVAAVDTAPTAAEALAAGAAPFLPRNAPDAPHHLPPCAAPPCSAATGNC